VIRFLSDANVKIREEAAKTCIAVLDVVVLRIKHDSENYYYMCQIIDRLLIFGIGDDSDMIRCNVFLNFTPSLDYIISQSENIHCIIESLDDENLEVRKAGMSLLARVAHYDTLHIMPVIMLSLKTLLRQLESSNDVKLKHSSVQVLQAMVSGINTLIQPFVKQILKALMNLLTEKSSEIVSSSLSTISELAITCPEPVREHLDELFTHLINALKDESSMNKKEIAVIAIGKLVSSLTLVTEETYLKYPGLFEGLMQAIKTVGVGSTELRIQVIKTVGLLGVVKSDQYQKHLLNGDIIATEDVRDEYEEDVADFDKANKLSKLESYYLSIVTKGLMDILRDLSLSTHHYTASVALIKVVRLSGPQLLPLLSQLLDCIINRLYLTEFGNNLRVHLLDHIISLIQIVGKQIRNYQDKIVKLVCDFFDFHLQQCLDIIESLCVVIPLQDFNLVLRCVLPSLLNYIKDEPFETNPDVEQIVDSSNLSSATNANQSNKTASDKTRATSIRVTNKNVLPKTKKILKTISAISCSLGEYRRDLIPIAIGVMNDETASLGMLLFFLFFLCYFLIF
jgi:FKBP12-rapamycin complex-associated protein